jgi:hypothetical protein
MRRSATVPLGSGFVALAGIVAASGLVSGCSNQPEEQVYCADRDGVIADDDACDDSRAGSHFFWIGPYGRGLLPGHRLSGGTKVPVTDAAARRQNGLPGTGKVTNGSVVHGGFGSGS